MANDNGVSAMDNGAQESKSKLPAKAAPAKPAKVKRVGRIRKWYREMKSEPKKVVWPTPKSTAAQTAVALAAMLAAAIVIWGFDTLATSGVRALITLASGG